MALFQLKKFHLAYGITNCFTQNDKANSNHIFNILVAINTWYHEIMSKDSSMLHLVTPSSFSHTMNFLSRPFSTTGVYRQSSSGRHRNRFIFRGVSCRDNFGRVYRPLKLLDYCSATSQLPAQALRQLDNFMLPSNLTLSDYGECDNDCSRSLL